MPTNIEGTNSDVLWQEAISDVRQWYDHQEKKRREAVKLSRYLQGETIRTYEAYLKQAAKEANVDLEAIYADAIRRHKVRV